MNEVASDIVWNLGDLYSSPDDPDLERDKIWCREEAGRFSALYRERVLKLTAPELLNAISQLEALQEKIVKLVSFASLYFSTRIQEPAASSLWQSVQEFYSEINRDTLFFELEWTQLDEEKASMLSDADELKGYRHYLNSLRRYKPHMLSELEERVLAEKEPIGAPAWNTLFDKVLGQLRFGDRGRSESEVLSDLYHPDRELRRVAADELTAGLGSVLHVLTHIFNTVLLDRAITDRLRKYPHWLRSRNLSNEAQDSMVRSLVEAVTGKYDLVQRYYGVKRKLLGYDRLFDYDRYAPIPGPSTEKISWEEARDTVLSSYSAFSPEMADIASRFFKDSWIHAPVLAGKRSGAFAHPTVPSVHPYVLLNFTGTHRDVMTLAHELGHGVHQYLARSQGLINSDTPLTTAESASVFGEMLVFRHLLGKVQNPAERLALLCGKLEDTFATVFRQVSMNRFEDAVHNGRRASGELDPERISDIWMDSQRAMFGESVTLSDNYRTWWSYIPHFFHSPGYVYAYAFGELLVLALYGQYTERGASFVPMYLNLLSSGGSLSPNDLLKPFGIDLADPAFWDLGLKVLDGMVSEAEETSKNL